MLSRKILVVSGEFELLSHARQALSDLGFAFQAAYSHRDALYAARTYDFDAVLVHALMRDRRTGEFTAEAVHRIRKDRVLILYFPEDNERLAPHDEVASQFSFIGLDDSVIRSTVLQSMHRFTAPLRNTLNLRGRDDSEYWDVEEVQTLLSLSRSLTEVLDLGEVLNRVVEAARDLTDAEEGMILLPDGEASDLYLRARVGMDVTTARNFRVRTSDSVAGQVYRSGQPMIIGARGPTKVKTQYFVNSLLYVPILFKGQPIGVLGVNNRDRENVFNSHHEALLLNLAAYAAVAIENARIHEQSVRRARDLKALVDASDAINASLSLQNTLLAICEQMTSALRIDQTEIYEWSKDERSLRSLARHYQTIWLPGDEPTMAFADYSFLRTLVREKRPVYIRADKADGRSEQAYLRRLGAQSMLAMPLSSDEQVFGVLIAYYGSLPQTLPSPEECQAIEYHALSILIDHIDKGRRWGSHMLANGHQINQMAGADWCDYWLIAPEGGASTGHISIGQVSWINHDGPLFSLDAFPDLSEALETQMLINQHMEGDLLTQGVRALLDTSRSRSVLALPLLVRGQTMGIIACYDAATHRVFSPAQVELARAIVAQAGTALENSRLLHDLEISYTQLKDTQERLIQAERLSAMGELAAAVAHQINNPLTTLLVDTELLLLNEPANSEDYQTLQAMLRAGKRAGSVVRRLLGAVRRNVDAAPFQPINVITTIEETLSLVKSHIERDGMVITSVMPTEPIPPVLAVAGELEDVWLNLLLNAHDALVGRSGARITIHAEFSADEGLLRVHVTDNGPGIEESIRVAIFDAFFTTKPIGEGTGLGLHICRQVVQKIGGTITVQTAVGQGTRFTVNLPIMRGD